LKNYFGLPSSERAALRWAWVVIGISKFLLPFVPLPRLISMVRRMATPKYKTTVEVVSPERLAEIVAIAGARTLGATCLHRSLALLVLLRRYSVPARLTIGVNRDHGFTAHAWVEVKGAVAPQNTTTLDAREPLPVLRRSHPAEADYAPLLEYEV
jgi:hypothetical protein